MVQGQRSRTLVDLCAETCELRQGALRPRFVGTSLVVGPFSNLARCIGFEQVYDAAVRGRAHPWVLMLNCLSAQHFLYGRLSFISPYACAKHRWSLYRLGSCAFALPLGSG